jgi:predicted ABC-type ATPase
MIKPQAIFYAGPNGSGKSTLRQAENNPSLRHIDSDLILKSLRLQDPYARDIAAGKEAIQQFQLAIAEKVPFSLESTLSGVSILKRMHKAKDAGYNVELQYIGLNFPELNIARVESRYAKGGHYIEPSVITRRYRESLENLPIAINIADKALVWDNSYTLPHNYLIIEDKVISKATDLPLPSWLANIQPGLQAHLLLEGQPSQAQDHHNIKVIGREHGLIIRDALDLKSDYTGKVISISSQHLLVKLSENIAICYPKNVLNRVVQLDEKVTIYYYPDKFRVSEIILFNL